MLVLKSQPGMWVTVEHGGEKLKVKLDVKHGPHGPAFRLFWDGPLSFVIYRDGSTKREG